MGQWDVLGVHKQVQTELEPSPSSFPLSHPLCSYVPSISGGSQVTSAKASGSFEPSVHRWED